jgi:hypothetical protein
VSPKVPYQCDLKNKYLDFSKQHGWKESSNSVFRVNTAEGYEALNLKSNGKNNIDPYTGIRRKCFALNHE